MTIGALRNLVSIQQLTGARDPDGHVRSEWQEVTKVWADIRHRSGREAIQGDRPVSTAQVSMRVRRSSDITAAMRAVHDGVVYEILAVNPDLVSRDRMDLVCEVVRA